MVNTNDMLMFAGEVRQKMAQNNFYQADVVKELVSNIPCDSYDFNPYTGMLKIEGKVNDALPTDLNNLYNFLELPFNSTYKKFTNRLMTVLGKETLERFFATPKKLFYIAVPVSDVSIIIYL